MNEGSFFRANVGAVFSSAEGNVLAFRRADVEGDAWQFPQGGIDGDEEPDVALRREIEEELGLEPEDYETVARSARWYAYELPDAYRSPKVGRGQVQKWFHCRLRVPENRIRLDGVEFDAMRWFTPAEICELVVSFRRQTYRSVMQEFGLL